MENEPYIKLSRIRDYGIDKEEGDLILKLGELDDMSDDQLRGLKEILVEEVEDIDYQIEHEMKHLEHDLKWRYGAKSSKKARENFIHRIEEFLQESGDSDELTELRAFYHQAELILNSDTMRRIRQAVSDTCLPETDSVFGDVDD